MTNKELQNWLKQYPDDAQILVEAETQLPNAVLPIKDYVSPNDFSWSLFEYSRARSWWTCHCDKEEKKILRNKIIICKPHVPVFTKIRMLSPKQAERIKNSGHIQ